MKVLITGGTGFIGGALANDLVADGHEVVVLTRNPSRRPQRLPDPVRLVEWDARSGEGWSKELEDALAIVNLAGETIGPEGGLWTKTRKRRIKESRVNATRAVVDAIRRVEVKPAVLVQASAVGYYGPREDEIITEEAAPGSDFLSDVCQAWERASQPVEEMGVRRAIFRTGIVLSTEGNSLPLAMLPFRFFVGGPLGSGRQYWPWIHWKDEIGAIRFLLETERASGAFNLTAPNPVTNREFAQTLGKVMRRPSFVPAPGFAIKLALQEMSTVVLDGQRVVPRALREAGYKFHFPELDGALRDLLEPA